MSKYEFSLSGASTVILNENGDTRFYLSEEPQFTLFVDDGDDVDSITKFKPTYDFWCELVRLNTFTSKLCEYRSHHSAYDIPDWTTPDISGYKIPYNRELPKYEAKIAHQIGWTIFEKRNESNTMMDENPELRRLFRHAYAEVTGEVPEYLKDSFS